MDILDQLRDEDKSVRLQGLKTLREQQDVPIDVLEDLFQQFTGFLSSDEGWGVTLDVIADRIGVVCLPQVIELLGSKNNRQKIAACQLFARWGDKAKEAVDPLVELSSYFHAMFQKERTRALVAIGPVCVSRISESKHLRANLEVLDGLGAGARDALEAVLNYGRAELQRGRDLWPIVLDILDKIGICNKEVKEFLVEVLMKVGKVDYMVEAVIKLKEKNNIHLAPTLLPYLESKDEGQRVIAVFHCEHFPELQGKLEQLIENDPSKKVVEASRTILKKLTATPSKPAKVSKKLQKMIDEIIDGGVEEEEQWEQFSAVADSRALHAVATDYNWDYGVETLLGIALHPKCEAATAQSIYLTACSDGYLCEYTDTSELEDDGEKEYFELVLEIERRWESGHYPVEHIANNPGLTTERINEIISRTKRSVPPSIFDPIFV